MLYDKFKIKKNSIIAVTGSGGKTSLMFSLAKELSQKGRVLVTTTTKIFEPERNQYENLFLVNENEKKHFRGTEKNIDILGKEIKEGKFISPVEKDIEKIKSLYDYIIYEADGSKQKLMKYWKEDEPCLLSFTDKIIGVANIKVLGLSFDEKNVHRFNMYMNSNNKKYSNQKYIDKNILEEYIVNGKFFGEDEELKNRAEKIIFLNGVESEEEILTAFELSKKLNKVQNFMFGSVKEKKIYSPRKISAVVMGSGEARRFGSNKLLYEINGISMIEVLLKKLSRLPFEKIFVTYKDKEIFEICKKYNVVPLENKNYFMGQSESIKLGTAQIKDEDIIFFTGDMPFLKEETIKKIIINSWKDNLITIPCVKDQRFSPVIFPNRYKNELMKLNGDVGGKEIIKKESKINFVSFESREEFIDIDTKEELKNFEGGNKNV